MANMMDYLDWRGDLTFQQSEFNEVDNLLLAQLSYVDFEGIVPALGSPGSIMAKEASELFFQQHDEKELLASTSLLRMCPFVFKKMAQSRRFEAIKLSNYINTIDESLQKQFSAITIELDAQTLYVAFRGTDDTIIGWKEDFNMSYMSPVPAQIEAARYVDEAVGHQYTQIYFGGHSKGGNLAIYAAVNCSPSIRERIKTVFNNDGPGFDRKVIESQAYQEMRQRIRTIVPHSSIVGMLLEHEDQYMVVKSSQTGIMQHDAITWEVLGNRFVTVNNISGRSRLLEAALKSWIDKLDNKEREQFVETLYKVFDEVGVKNLTDLSRDKLKKMREIMKAFGSMAPENREVLWRTVKILFQESNRIIRSWRRSSLT